MAERDRVLLVASWGFPRSWREVKYYVSIKNKAFENFQPVVCRARSSTLAIAAALLRWGYDVEVVIYGTDTLVSPDDGEVGGDGARLRHLARESYLGSLNRMVSECSCCSELSSSLPGKVSVVVVPGLGLYYGYRFNASIEHVFNKVFVDLYVRLGDRERSVKWVFIDLTHGVNYLMVATLYAAVAAAVLFGKEGRVVMLNSMPVQPLPQTARGELAAQTIGRQALEEGGEPPVVEVADVSRLQYGISFIRSLMSLRSFDTEPVKEALKNLRKQGGEVPEDVLDLIGRAATFLDLIRNGMAALAYPGSCRSSSSEAWKCVKLGFNVCEELGKYRREPDPAEYDYVPTIDRNSRTVDYGRTDVWTTLLRYPLVKVLEDICKEMGGSDNLVEFLGRTRKVLSSKKYEAISLLVEKENENLGRFVKGLEEYVKKCGEPLKRLGVLPDDVEAALSSGDEVNVDILLYRLFTELGGECEREEVHEVVRRHREEVAKSIERMDDGKTSGICRNIVAHSGLEYDLVKGFTIARRGGKITITKVFYIEKIDEIVRKCLGLNV